MKQTGILIEVVLDDNNQPTIIIRSANNGQIQKVTKDPSEVITFLEKIITLMSHPADSPSNHE